MVEKLVTRRQLGWLAGSLALALWPEGHQALRRLTGRPREAKPKKPGGIVVHHSAAAPKYQAHENARVIDLYHEAKGFRITYEGKVYHIAYHYVIRPDGTIEKGRPDYCRGDHTRVEKYNHWLGICLIGYFDPKWPDPKYHRPTPAQMRSLVQLSVRLMKLYDFGVTEIKPHHDINLTECPGRSFPMARYLALVRDEMESRSIRNHHLESRPG